MLITTREDQQNWFECTFEADSVIVTVLAILGTLKYQQELLYSEDGFAVERGASFIGT